MTHLHATSQCPYVRRRTPARAAVLLAVAAMLTAGAALSVRAVAAAPAPQQPKKAVSLWTCSMHPQVIEDHPGTCPICGMDLVPLKSSTASVTATAPEAADATAAPPLAATPAPPAASAGKRKILFYRNPMDPSVTSPVPMKDSMGMDYVPVYAGAAAPAATPPVAPAAPASRGEGAHRGKVLFYCNPMNPAITSPVPMKDEMGMDYVPVYADEAAAARRQGAVVTIDPAVVQNMNVVTAVVRRRDVTRQIRTVGTLEYDPERVVSVTTKYDGFVEKVFANYLGQTVRRGDPLFEIYAPELVQTEQELLSALEFSRQLEGTPGDAARRAAALVDAARTRLSYWDISPSQIAGIERSGKVLRTLTVTAPASGVVIDRMEGLEGMAVKPGMNVLKVADLSHLWLEAEVFDNQLPWVREGSTAQVSVPYFPGETFTGRVRFVEPQLSDKTRSVRLTFEIPNRGGRLRANMYATVVFEPVAVRSAVVVPSSAVLRTGERNVVIVALGAGRFAPRDVILGVEGDGVVQVLSGIGPGEEVVTSAQFLIDSESNLQAAIQQMIESKMKSAGGGDAR